MVIKKIVFHQFDFTKNLKMIFLGNKNFSLDQ